MTVYYVCPFNENRPLGGVRVLYRHVDILNDAGIPAALVHGVHGFRCTWFDNDTRVVSPPVELGAGDVLALPEASAPRLPAIAPGVPKVVINQNAYGTWDGVPWTQQHPYLRSPDLAAVACVSEQNRAMLAQAFPELLVHRVKVSVDCTIFTPPTSAEGRLRRLAYMPRKRLHEANQVLGTLQNIGALAGWEVVALHSMTQREVAATLRTCALFLSFCEREGFGLPPLEALASGCFVIGYTGSAAEEYFDVRFSTAIPDGDVQTYVRTVSEWLRAWDPQSSMPATRAASVFATSTYSREAERDTVLGLYEAVFRASARRPSVDRAVLRREDTSMPASVQDGGTLYRRLRRACRVVLQGA